MNKAILGFAFFTTAVAMSWTLFPIPAMAACSVTYPTFSNGTPADGSQVTQNFSDLTGCAAPSASRTFTGIVSLPGSSVLTTTGDLGLGANANIGGYGNGRYLTIRGAGGTPFAADGRLELTNPNTPANDNDTGEILFEQEGNGGDIRTGEISMVAQGFGGADGFGGNLTFITKVDNSASFNGIQMTNTGWLVPSADNAQQLGQSGNRWSVVYAANGTIQTSDGRLKKNIASLTSHDGLAAILKLRPVTFQWKERSSDKKSHYGFVAQEVEEVVPKVVDVGADSRHTLGINYQALIPSIVKAIQELDRKVDGGRMPVDSVDNHKDPAIALRRQQAEIARLEATNSIELTEISLLKTQLGALRRGVRFQTAQK